MISFNWSFSARKKVPKCPYVIFLFVLNCFYISERINMKKLFWFFISMTAFIFAGTGEIKEINDSLQKKEKTHIAEIRADLFSWEK